MFFVDNVLVSEGLKTARFQCDFSLCSGACCVEGDRGAPLNTEEYVKIEEIAKDIREHLDEDSSEIVRRIGGVFSDRDGRYTMLHPNEGPCVFQIRNIKGREGCVLEELWQKGQIEVRKPVSCHLFPILIKESKTTTLLTFEERYTCEGCWDKGPLLVEYCKEPLIRRFGQRFVRKLYKQIGIEFTEL
jgi:hypothetical protein